MKRGLLNQITLVHGEVFLNNYITAQKLQVIGIISKGGNNRFPQTKIID